MVSARSRPAIKSSRLSLGTDIAGVLPAEDDDVPDGPTGAEVPADEEALPAEDADVLPDPDVPVEAVVLPVPDVPAGAAALPDPDADALPAEGAEAEAGAEPFEAAAF